MTERSSSFGGYHDVISSCVSQIRTDRERDRRSRVWRLLSLDEPYAFPSEACRRKKLILADAEWNQSSPVRWGPAHSRAEQSASAVIGPDGGTLSLPGSDFTMNIPSRALSAPTTITVVAKGGPYVAYEMLPHGLQFLKPVTAVQGLQNTATYGTDAGNAIRTGYLPEGSDAIDCR